VSSLMLDPARVNCRFYCGRCEGDSYADDQPLSDTIMDGLPVCEFCDREMDLEWLLLPSSEPKEANQI